MKVKSGQVGLLLLVVLPLVVGIALSLASRSLSDTVLSRQESESSKAFRLAESGVEQALNSIRQGSNVSQIPLTGDSVFSGSTAVVGSDTLGLFVKEGELAHLDVTSFAPGTLTIDWTRSQVASEDTTSCSEGSGNAPAAIEVIAYKSDDTVSYTYYNGYGCVLGNNFGQANSGVDPFLSTVSYSVTANTLYLRIRPLYNDATIEVDGSGLSTQLYLIQSKAEGGDAQKEIEVKRGLDAPGSVFDYALFSGSTIVK